MLQQALAELLRTRDFEGLSVQEITETAGLNRATFYAHYSDKFALLECMVASRFQALLTSRAVVFDGSCPAAIRGIALGVCDYLAELLDPASPPGDPNPAARGSQRQKHLAPHVEASIAAVVRQMLLDGLRQHPVAGTDPPEMLASAASWAIYGAAREWVATAHRQPSEEFASAVQRLVAPLLGIA
jgi:AcrR family transcriptional regulator